MALQTSNLIIKLDELTQQFDDLEAQLMDPSIGSDPDRMREVGIKRGALVSIIERYREYKTLADQIRDNEELIAAADSNVGEAGHDDMAELAEMAREELPELREQADALLEAIANELVTADDASIGSVMLEIRSASGGDEAALWAGDLLEMYQKFATLKKWKFEPLEVAAGDMGGIRHCVINVRGQGVWQSLGYESGVHCVKRVPATESQGRVHTSTATVAVLPEPEKVQLVVNPDEVEEHITTAQGPGGQNVNKVATAVHLIHKPTGIEVRMQESKSQKQNREKAWQLLRTRLFDHEQRQKDAERAESRSAMIGTGGRSERIRTYRYKENIAVDHRLGDSFALQGLLNGELDELNEALVAQDRAQRLAAL